MDYNLLKNYSKTPKKLKAEGLDFYCLPLTPRILKELGAGENEDYNERVIKLLVCDSEGNKVFSEEDSFEDIPLEIQTAIVQAIVESVQPKKN